MWSLWPTLSLTGHPGDHHRQQEPRPVEVCAAPGLRAGVDSERRGQPPGRRWGHLGRGLQAIQQWHVRAFLDSQPLLGDHWGAGAFYPAPSLKCSLEHLELLPCFILGETEAPKGKDFLFSSPESVPGLM